MSEENIERIRVAYDIAFAQRSMKGVLDRIADDFIWRQRPEWPGRDVYTADDIELLWAELDATYSEFEIAPVDFVAGGDYVVATVKTSARLRESDVRATGTIWHVWRLRDGLVVQGQTFGNESDALAAAGLDA